MTDHWDAAYVTSQASGITATKQAKAWETLPGLGDLTLDPLQSLR